MLYKSIKQIKIFSEIAHFTKPYTKQAPGDLNPMVPDILGLVCFKNVNDQASPNFPLLFHELIDMFLRTFHNL